MMQENHNFFSFLKFLKKQEKITSKPLFNFSFFFYFTPDMLLPPLSSSSALLFLRSSFRSSFSLFLPIQLAPNRIPLSYFRFPSLRRPHWVHYGAKTNKEPFCLQVYLLRLAENIGSLRLGLFGFEPAGGGLLQRQESHLK